MAPINCSVPAYPPRSHRRPGGYATPHAQPALPHRQRPPPVMWHVERGGEIEIDPAADDPGRHCPQGHVVDQCPVAAPRSPAPAGDVDGQRDPGQIHQPVNVNEQRAQVNAIDRRAGDERHDGPTADPSWHIIAGSINRPVRGRAQSGTAMAWRTDHNLIMAGMQQRELDVSGHVVDESDDGHWSDPSEIRLCSHARNG
jgi:hypothetical protein